MRPKAFFINGGAGRVLSSIPALEKYAETHDDFVIVCEAGTDFYKGHPVTDFEGYAGYLIRSKPASENEGGIHSGMGILDSLVLMSD